MGEMINGYELLKPLSNKDAGFAKWGHAEKGGRDYFIKELLNPRYPTKDSPYGEAERGRIVQSCKRFESERSLLYKRINEVSDGNLMRVEDFFCWDGRYYVVTKWLDPVSKRDVPGASPFSSKGENLAIEDLSCVGSQVRVRACVALSHAIMRLHIAKIVHADIKPSNIILTRLASGGISAKVIDMESSFFESEVPEELIGDQVYFAPESVLRMLGKPDAPPVSRAIDVFAMGLIFHQALVGRLPDLPNECDYAFEACLEGYVLKADGGVPPGLRGIVERMLMVDANARPDMAEVYRSFWGVLHGEGRAPEPEPGSTSKPGRIDVPEIGEVDNEGEEDREGSRVSFNFPRAKTSAVSSAETAHVDMGEVFYRPKGL